MPRNASGTALLTDNGVDGACAAAMGLLAFPGAEVIVTSARRIGVTLASLQGKTFGAVHVCGVGIYCDWMEVEKAARMLKAEGTALHWHCGRGYLDDRLEELRGVCTPAFMHVGTNTAAVARTLGLESARLTTLAAFDTHLPAATSLKKATPDQTLWLDFIEAALAQYFKFQDSAPYVHAIRCLARGELGEQERRLTEAFRRTGYTHLLYGQSDSLRHLKERIQRCADANRPVIITGESGVGKEHVAHLLWERGPRALGPLIPVNCSLYAGNTALANSDLFGHKKGAFTGANKDRKGKFVEADGGLLFLDELGELPLEVQAKLLRVVEDGKVTPEGADRHEAEVDVGIIAATNQDLVAMVRRGTFRADLYHRLATLRIHVPPLRERTGDIRGIAEQRLKTLEAEGHATKFSERDWRLLKDYDWPGNVRQLIKLVDRAVLLGLTVPEALREERELGEVREARENEALNLLPTERRQVRPLDDVVRQYAHNAWLLHDKNYSATAKTLGIAENTLRYSYLK
ncbi:MAG: sigma-54-dependent Fis family transcriptional regulator [Candidatus Hydrogenedentes bacterium]|nr:sigma-54-dependent Fis family transcriptional regulator [Candidatus Hydrogenedentota bacterium]